MFDTVKKILKEKNILFHQNVGITIATVPSLHDGYAVTKDLLYATVDTKTVLYLSGGNTPKELYKKLAEEEQLLPGAVGMVDERFGPKLHEKSNEKMMQETGLLRYLHMRAIPFYPILTGRHREPEGRGDLQGIASSSSTPRNDELRKQTAAAYDEKVRSLHATFQKSVAILGIGTDGHTAGIAPNRKEFKNPLFAPSQKHMLVSEFDDPKSFYGERVGMTFLGLTMQDLLLVFVFGAEKKEALELVFTDGSEEEIPSRFFKRPDVAKKTLFITDQRI